MSVPNVIDLNDLTVAYERSPAVSRVSGGFAQGSLTAIVGPNGAGKSTLLKALMGILRPSSGGINLHGLSRSQIAYLPQRSEVDRTFPITVFDVVVSGAFSKIGIFRPVDHAVAARVREALRKVGLEGFEEQLIGALSSGQFQRVLFARTFLQDARVILLDEPFTAIDTRTTNDLLELIAEWNGKEGRTVISVLHDLAQVTRYFPQTVLLARELIFWGDTKCALTPENLLSARLTSEKWDQSLTAYDRKAGVAA